LRRFEPFEAARDQSGRKLAPWVWIMRAAQLSKWQIATLVLASIAVIAIAAVALIVGKEAVIAIAVIFAVAYWFFNLS
jgi:hypothetical protein